MHTKKEAVDTAWARRDFGEILISLKDQAEKEAVALMQGNNVGG